MVDEFYDRHYREGRAELNSAISHALIRFGVAIAETFKVLNRIEYSAPWATKSGRIRSH